MNDLTYKFINVCLGLTMLSLSILMLAGAVLVVRIMFLGL